METEFPIYILLIGSFIGYHFYLRSWVEDAVSNYMLLKYFYTSILILYLLLLLLITPYYFIVALICLIVAHIIDIICAIYQKNINI